MVTNRAHKSWKAGPVLILSALLAAMISTLLASSKCVSLPVDASEEEIKIETLKLLTEHAQDHVTIEGYSLLQNDLLDEKVVRRSAGYTSGNEVSVSRSNTGTKICVEQVKPGDKDP